MNEKTTEYKIPVLVHFDNKDLDKLHKTANEQKVSRSELIRRSVKQYLANIGD